MGSVRSVLRRDRTERATRRLATAALLLSLSGVGIAAFAWLDWHELRRVHPGFVRVAALCVACGAITAAVAVSMWRRLSRDATTTSAGWLGRRLLVVAGAPLLLALFIPNRTPGRISMVPTAQGAPRWTVETAPFILSVLIVDDVVLVRSGASCGGAGTVRALDARTGERLWSIDAGIRRDEVLRPAAPTAIAVRGTDAIFLAGSRVVAVEARSGETTWSADVEATAGPFVLGDVLVVVEESSLAASAGGNPIGSPRVTALRPRDGGIAWTSRLPTGHQIVGVDIDDTTVRVNHADTTQGQPHVTHIDAATGRLVSDQEANGDVSNMQLFDAFNAVRRVPLDDGANLEVVNGDYGGCVPD